MLCEFYLSKKKKIAKKGWKSREFPLTTIRKKNETEGETGEI